ncbi:hypothetical protein [Falsiroseomonas sp. HW251]|uniref:hypothetical protein n=1 Tax=Falsiroseomonas sp. HW251 TaxID=3390998 RepID=UPI003D319132
MLYLSPIATGRAPPWEPAYATRIQSHLAIYFWLVGGVPLVLAGVTLACWPLAAAELRRSHHAPVYVVLGIVVALIGLCLGCSRPMGAPTAFCVTWPPTFAEIVADHEGAAGMMSSSFCERRTADVMPEEPQLPQLVIDGSVLGPS